MDIEEIFGDLPYRPISSIKHYLPDSHGIEDYPQYSATAFRKKGMPFLIFLPEQTNGICGEYVPAKKIDTSLIPNQARLLTREIADHKIEISRGLEDVTGVWEVVIPENTYTDDLATAITAYQIAKGQDDRIIYIDTNGVFLKQTPENGKTRFCMLTSSELSPTDQILIEERTEQAIAEQIGGQLSLVSKKYRDSHHFSLHEYIQKEIHLLAQEIDVHIQNHLPKDASLLFNVEHLKNKDMKLNLDDMHPKKVKTYGFVVSALTELDFPHDICTSELSELVEQKLELKGNGRGRRTIKPIIERIRKNQKDLFKHLSR